MLINIIFNNYIKNAIKKNPEIRLMNYSTNKAYKEKIIDRLLDVLGKVVNSDKN